MINRIPLQEFTASRQATLFQSLKQSQFSGQLVITEIKGIESIFYLYLGRIIYVTEGIHPVRRWRRNLALYCPEIATNTATIQRDVATIKDQDCSISWDYQLLCLWVNQQKITREQVTRMIRAMIAEVLFDLSQAGQVTYELKPDKVLSVLPVLIDSDQVIAEAWRLWQAWQSAKLADRFPNQAPIIRQPELLRSRTSPQTYQILTQRLNGQNSLRDLAVQLKQDVLQVTSLLMLYIQVGLATLVDIPDLPVPIASPPKKRPRSSDAKKSLIAYVGDNSVINLTMEKIITSAGYQFTAANTQIEAIACFLDNKPDLIFLDLDISNTNGYDICNQLHQFNVLRDIPIIILTENLGIIDRMRAKMAGCSGLLAQPVDSHKILSAIARYLSQRTMLQFS